MPRARADALNLERNPKELPANQLRCSHFCQERALAEHDGHPVVSERSTNPARHPHGLDACLRGSFAAADDPGAAVREDCCVDPFRGTPIHGPLFTSRLGGAPAVAAASMPCAHQ